MGENALVKETIERLFAAIETRDLRVIGPLLHPDVSWQNVPHRPAQGREAVLQLLGNILCWSDRVQWDVISKSVSETAGWYERLDRFWLAGEEHAVACNGVFEVDVASKTVIAVRDYVDLSEWRLRVDPVMALLARRRAVEVVARHIEAVETQDAVAMCSDYALDAVLERPTATYRGWSAIADYFDTVPPRLGNQRVSFSPIESLYSDQARVSWHIDREGESPVSGSDIFTVIGGRIVRQVTELEGADF